MKVLSLSQPYASLLFMPANNWADKMAKSWETRPWKPGWYNYDKIKEEGMLIHASSSLQYKYVIDADPFTEYIKDWSQLPFGCIIGIVKCNNIISTDSWISKHAHHSWSEEESFGDYSSGRWAWELKEARKFETPIMIKGKLNLWDFPEEDAVMYDKLKWNLNNAA